VEVTPVSNWWISREGTVGQIVSSFDPRQLTDLSVQWHVVQDSTKPNATSQGPYPTQAAAQAQADSLNKGESGLAPAAKAAVTDTVGKVNVGNLILRGAEILLGIVLIAVGLEHITGSENAISKIAKTGVIAAA
jgi:hypothetical protein